MTTQTERVLRLVKEAGERTVPCPECQHHEIRLVDCLTCNNSQIPDPSTEWCRVLVNGIEVSE